MSTVAVVVLALVVLVWVIYKNVYRTKLPLATPKAAQSNSDSVNYYIPPDMAYWHNPKRK
jgi:hypothetical protein